jgi:hypothetical protein
MLSFTTKSGRSPQKFPSYGLFTSSSDPASTSVNLIEKYRPKSLDELKLHAAKLKTLKEWFANNVFNGMVYQSGIT